MRIPRISRALNAEIRRLEITKPARTRSYYFFSLFAESDGKFHYDVSSKWVGFTDGNPKREIRCARLVNAPALVARFRKIREPVFVINTLKDLRLFFLIIGGMAVIEERLAYRYLKDWIGPAVSASSFDGGLESIQTVPEEKLKRRPSRKVRAHVLTRDNNRCRLCGASPNENKHVLLDLHHITPYSLAGLTDENNLVTLCRLCHNSLDPHYDLSLYSKIGVDRLSKRLNVEPYSDRLQWNIYSGLTRPVALNWRSLVLCCSGKEIRYNFLKLASDFANRFRPKKPYK